MGVAHSGLWAPGPGESSRTLSSLVFIENYRGRFVFIPKVLGDIFFNNNRTILILKCENTTSQNHS